METHVPDVELFMVFKWLIVLLIGAAVAQLASLMVKKWWYGAEKHDRRGDSEQSRGWITRFLDQQKEYTSSNILLGQKIDAVLIALHNNGKIIEDFTEETRCRYEGKGHGR